MATQREINRMSDYDRRQLLRNCIRELNSQLNLFGIDSEPLDGLLDSLAAEREIEYRLDEIMKPQCSCRKGDSSCESNGHGFPPWFMREAEPAAHRFLKTWRQIAKAPARG